MLSRFRKEINNFVSKVSKKEITTENTATSLEDLELILLQNDVALQTTQDLLSNLSNNITLLVSSLAAAQSVETIGNKYTISKLKILKTLENILK